MQDFTDPEARKYEGAVMTDLTRAHVEDLACRHENASEFWAAIDGHDERVTHNQTAAALRAMVAPDEAEAMVTAAYKAAAARCEEKAKANPASQGEYLNAAHAIRALTPNDARAALDRVVADAVARERAQGGEG